MATDRPDRHRILGGRWEYDTEDEFPAGKSAQAYAGKDLKTGEEVVVKIFSHAIGGLGRARFRREAKLHEELEHETILKLLGRGSEDGVDYIVTRRLRPGSLWHAVRGGSGLSPAKTMAIAIRIADALAYMHGRDEVHGDISPGNILLDADDAYLADFGLSKRIATLGVATTSDGFETPGFSPPRPPGVQRTYEDDVYGLAAVLWFCLTGKAPSKSPRVRRREIRGRALRAPLNRVLEWEAEPIPTAAAFKGILEKQWAKVGRDWRAVSTPRRRSRAPLVVAAALVGLVVAGFGGQTLRPKPAEAAQTTIDRNGVNLTLDGKWHSRPAVQSPGLRLRKPVAAVNGSKAVIVVGRSRPAGSRLISSRARGSLPRDARRPRPVLVGEHAALRYGPASLFGGAVAVEVFALPLVNDVLVVRCSGPAVSLQRICAQAAANLRLRDGSMQGLAPSASMARRLRAATDRLRDERQRQRLLLASTKDQGKLSTAAGDLMRANRSFARSVAALPTTAQDVESIDGVVGAARRAEIAYADLARAKTQSAWSSAQTEVDRSEQRLEAAIRHLAALRVYRD